MNERTIIHMPHFEDLLDRIARFESVTIAGRVYTADLLLPQLTVNATDLVSEAATCAAFVLYWGITASQARRFAAQVEASYRSWRDQLFLKLKSIPLEATGKPPTDAVAEKMYRTDSEYGDWSQRKDDAQEGAEMAEAIHEAFKAKKELIQAMGRIMHDEAGGAYLVSENPRQSVPRQPQLSEAVSNE